MKLPRRSQTAYSRRKIPYLEGELVMCEFNVILDGKTQFKDVVYAKVQGGNVIVKDVLGETKIFSNCVITEVEVNSAKLVLKAV
jgi:predicted RNA-binding protein